MDLIEAVKKRKSIRGYKRDPVPKAVLEQILELASRAPSAMNTQPWEFTVLTGDIVENLRRSNVELLNSGAPPGPEHVVVDWPKESIYRQRQVDLAIQLFRLVDIDRENKEQRMEWMKRGFRFFDAPAAFILSVDGSIGEFQAIFDVGILVQTICLAALHYGLGTCIENQSLYFPEVVRRFIHIPESKRLVTSIAIGYPDWEFPANKLESKREPLENVVNWCGYD